MLGVVITFIEPAPSTDHPVQSYLIFNDLMTGSSITALVPLDLYLSLIRAEKT